MLILRPYQQAAVDAVRNSYVQKHNAPLLVLPTGGGKTVCFSSIAQNVSERKKKVLIVVHRIELLRQTSQALYKSGVQHGIISRKFTPRYDLPVQVAMIETLRRRMHKIQLDFDLVVIDEAHHALADSWREVINHYKNARTLGVTATPCRTSGQGLGIDAGGMFDDIIIGPQIGELIKLGFLAKPIVYAPQTQIDLSGIKIVRGDYQNSELSKRMDNITITGDIIEHYKRICDKVPAVAFCVSVAHAEHVAEEFRKAGYNAFAVDGDMDDDLRKNILAGLANGRVHVVASCDLISEGMDIPAIGAALLLRPTASLGLYLQQVGRALRVIEGKKHAYILDHVGNVLTHGMPDEDREWSLEGVPKSNRKFNESGGKKPFQCKNCNMIHEPMPACPMCGFIYPIPAKELLPVVASGQLEEITEEMKVILKRNKLREEAQADTYEKLLEIERARGYKPGWAKYRWQARANKRGETNSIIQ